MKALTIRQPYATLIALGVKTIETRSWRAPQALIGQTIAIHAGKHRPKDVWCSASADPVFPPPLARLYDYGKCVDPQESNDGEWWRYRWDGPLGAIVATATLADCVPILLVPRHRADGDCITEVNGTLRHHHDWTATEGNWTLIEHQRPYGDFQPGRWAWLLTDVKPTTERCPACMGQKTATPGESLWDRVSPPWCRTCACDPYPLGTCPPIPAKGRQGLWEWQP